VTGLRETLAKANKLVTPTAREESSLRRRAKEVLARVETASSRFEEVSGVHLGGSFAKGTWLPRDVDLDIFVRMAEDVDGARFEKVGLSIGEEAVRGYPHGKKYAQHPYTEADVDGVKVNIVPCYDVKAGGWKSAADRSLFHVEFVNGHMSRFEKHQVRLLKRFMKAVGVYGAEIENEGFSGYATEVLVHSHGSFERVLTYFAHLRVSEKSPFTLRDPVDPDRELAAAVSKEKVARMVLASRSFLRSPGPAYFSKVRSKVRRKLAAKVFAIRFDHPSLSEDTLWGELKKSTRQVARYVESYGFSLSRASPASNNLDKSAILLLPEVDELSSLVERVGPTADMAGEAERFIAKNAEKSELIWVGDDGKVHVLQRRRFTKLSDLLGRVRSESIDEIGASKDVTASIKKTGRVLSGRGVTEESDKEEWFGEGVDAIVSDSIGTDPS
jgi:tRNA nucleotidyltransferase (CCA-adding enzyme)